jgi:Uma2 family endonuclease
MARPPAIEQDTSEIVVLDIHSLQLTDDQFLQLSHDNELLRLELTARGELIIMPGGNPETDYKNARITRQLGNWAEADGTGVYFGSCGIFTLPNTARRIPDGAWITKSRWLQFTKEERSKLPVICPDFVLELRSPSDTLPMLREKMEEYIQNGAQLGWLLDPIENQATIYRPGQPPETIDNPSIISGDPVLPGFRFDFSEIL